ncbi:MAG: response regulator, partial [Pseudomonadales bacterium]|nr:response regulator [Pseudomonadales bacterium]
MKIITLHTIGLSRICLGFFLFLGFHGLLFANTLNASDSLPPVLTLDEHHSQSMVGFLQYAVDDTGALTLQQLYDGEHALVFKDYAKQSLPGLNEYIWVRARVANPYDHDLQLVVNFEEILYDELLFGYPIDGQLRQWRAGLNYPFYDRPIPYRFLAMPLELPAGTSQTIYFRILASHMPLLSPSIGTTLSFASDMSNSAVINLTGMGLALGICLFMIIFMPLAMPSRETWGVIAFTCATTAVVGSYSGAYQAMLGDYPELHKYFMVALLALNSIANLFMVNSFFEVYKSNPVSHRIYKAAALVFAGIIVLYPWLGRYEVLMVATIACTLSMYMLLFYTAISKYRQGFPRSGWFLSGLLLFFVSSSFAAAGGEGLVPYDPLIRHTICIGIILQATLLSYATALKVRSNKEQAEEMEKRVVIADAASKEKSEFLATMSHEIRTPVNGVLGMAQMLEKTGLSPEQQYYNQVIFSSGSTLLAVINDILDFSKIEAGKMDLDPRPFDLNVLVENSAAMFLPQADDKQLAFNWRIDDDCPTSLLGDEIRIQQLLNNLLSNAFKFTETGSVYLQVRKKATAVAVQAESVDASMQILQFSVKDTGVGIASDKQKTIFSAFMQADRSTTREYGGTGLGLAICKQLVELMGGNIQLISAPGQGAEFVIELPLTVVSATSDTAKDKDQVTALDSATSLLMNQSATVLVAEDNPVNQQVIRAMLAYTGLNVIFANDGLQAFNMFKDHMNGEAQSISLILMDLEMPQMDGYETTLAIREYERRHDLAVTPIIAITAHVLEANAQRCYEVGMDQVLNKPVQLDKL